METPTKHIAYNKYIQSGGSTRALKEIQEFYRDRVCVFIADTSDVQCEQVLYRAEKEFGIPRDFIWYKTDEIKKRGDINQPGVIICNKTPSSLKTLWTKIPQDKSLVDIYCDESDYDCPGYEKQMSTVQKDDLLNKLYRHSHRVTHISATCIAYCISDINFDTLIDIPVSKEYLAWKEIQQVSVGDDDMQEMLLSGNLSPTVENFIIKFSGEGILIRTNRKIEDMFLIQKALKNLVPGVEVNVLNGKTKDSVNPRTVGGILIVYNMASRGITFPNLAHMIYDSTKGAPQPAEVQAAGRCLGYNKRLEGGNFLLATQKILNKLNACFDLEEKCKAIFKKYYNDVSERHKAIMQLEIDRNIVILPKGKENGIRKDKEDLFVKQHAKVPYIKELEELLIEEGKLLHRLVFTDNPGFPKWGGGRWHYMVNQPPQGNIKLDRYPSQHVGPNITVKCLVSKKEVEALTTQWMHVISEEGVCTHLALVELLEEPKDTCTYIFPED